MGALVAVNLFPNCFEKAKAGGRFLFFGLIAQNLIKCYIVALAHNVKNLYYHYEYKKNNSSFLVDSIVYDAVCGHRNNSFMDCFTDSVKFWVKCIRYSKTI